MIELPVLLVTTLRYWSANEIFAVEDWVPFVSSVELYRRVVPTAPVMVNAGVGGVVMLDRTIPTLVAGLTVKLVDAPVIVGEPVLSVAASVGLSALKRVIEPAGNVASPFVKLTVAG